MVSMRIGLALRIASACALAGCAGEVLSSQDFLFGFRDERRLECARGDAACVEVEDHLRAIHAETGSEVAAWCDAHPGAANFPWVCHELSPFVVWPELVGH